MRTKKAQISLPLSISLSIEQPSATCIYHIPFWIVKINQSFLLSGPRKKNLCFYYCMEKLNRVGRLENVFILLKILYGDNRMEKKTSGSAAKNRDSRMIVNKHTFFGPIHFCLLHLFHLALLGQEKIYLWLVSQVPCRKQLGSVCQHNFFILSSQTAPNIYGRSGNLKHTFSWIYLQECRLPLHNARPTLKNFCFPLPDSIKKEG